MTVEKRIAARIVELEASRDVIKARIPELKATLNALAVQLTAHNGAIEELKAFVSTEPQKSVDSPNDNVPIEGVVVQT